jgi:hypothetical protein
MEFERLRTLFSFRRKGHAVRKTDDDVVIEQNHNIFTVVSFCIK